MKKTYDESRLPVWARRELNRLRANLAHAEEKLAAGPEDSTVFADPYSNTPRPLGKDVTVQFMIGTAKILVREEEGRLYVNGGDTFAVRPHAANAVSIEPRRIGS